MLAISSFSSSQLIVFLLITRCFPTDKIFLMIIIRKYPVFFVYLRKAFDINMNKQVIESIKQTLHQYLPTGGRALLFGSQARGDAHAGSDWDILIILNKDKLLPDDYDNVTFPLTMLGWDLGEQINPIMYSAKEWEASRITPFYQNVVQDAIILA